MSAGKGEALLALAERVEAAAGPDRELDAEIAVALKVGARGLLPDDHEYLSTLCKDDYREGCPKGGYWFHCRSGKSFKTASPFTGSVDSALSTKDAEWLIDIEQTFDLGWEVELWIVGNVEVSKSTVARCQSLPSAIVAASLRARAALAQVPSL